MTSATAHAGAHHSPKGASALKAARHAKSLARLQKIARLMDTAWGIPFTRWRFGMDSVLGLVPGLGDAVTAGISLYAVYLARQLGAPPALQARMLGNVALDFGLGSIPVVGDVFDMFFKSNTRNLRLLTDFIEKSSRHR